MKKSPLFALIFLLIFSASAQVLDPNDPIVEYDPDNPPETPTWGTLSKWVISPSVNWNTDEWKSYYYNQVPFRLRWPNNYDPNRSEPYPMIVILHGRGFSNGTIYMNDRHLNNAGADTYENGINNGKFDGFILSPQGTSGYFGDGQFNAIEDIVSFIDQQHNLDINRISLTGRSAGAQAVWRFIAAKPKLFASALPMAGASLSAIDDISKFKYSPIWLFQGELDSNPTTYTAETVINELVNAGGNARYTVYLNSGHGIFGQAYNENDFFPYMIRARKYDPVVLDGELVLSIENNKKQEYDYYPKNGFCPGEDVIATLGLTPGYSGYEWRKDGVVISDANNNTLTVTEFGTYDARILRNGSWSNWSTKPITISEKAPTETPDIQVQGLASKVLPALDGKDSVILELPGGYVEYAWYNSGGSTVISTNKSFTARQPGDYEASVVEPFGCSSNRSQTFTVVDASGAQAPDPAIGVVGFAPSETSIQLNWSENPFPNYNETGFEIYYSETEGGPYTLSHITGPDELSYLHEDLIANTTYYYRIRAVNETGASEPTSELAITTLVDSEAPTAPTNLRVVSTSPTSVELAWDAASDNVGVWKYDIYRNDAKSVVTDQTTVTVYNLVSEQAYNFKIKARDITGNESPYSNQVVAATVFSGTPLANLKFEGDLSDDSGNGTNSTLRNGATYDNSIVYEGGQSLHLPSGNAYVDFDTGNDFIHNRFTTRTVAFWLYAESTNGIQDVFDEGGSTNGFALRINNGNIEVAVQDNHDIHLLGAPFTAGEWHHVAATFNSGELKLYVDAFEQASKNDINYNEDEVSDHGDGAGIGGTNGGNAFDQTNNNFTGYIDDFYIDNDVLNSSHLSGLMSGDDFVIPDNVPEAPTDLTATAVSYDAIDLTWTDNSADETGFQIYRSEHPEVDYSPIVIVDPDVTNFSDTDLQPETTYYYAVIALGEYGESEAPSNVSSIAELGLDNNLNDESDFGVSSQIRNGAAFSSSNVLAGSHSAYFPGSNDYFDLDVGNTFIHSEFNQRSVAFWFYADDVSGIQDIYDEGGSTNGFGIRINNGQLEFGVQDNHDINTILAPIPSREWVHQVSIFDNGTMYLYINGVLAATKENLNYSVVSSHGNGGGLGATNSSNAFDLASNNFNGYIDEFSAYDVAVTEGDVNKLYSLTSNKPFATTLSLPPSPAAPGNLTATATSGTSIDLLWVDNSSNEDGFRILRSSGTNTNYLKVAEIPSNSGSYSDSGLFSNVSYFYKVESYNAGGGSESDEASTTTLNTEPVIDDFGDLALRFDEELTISLFAEDPDNETLTFSSQNLPSFTSITDVGDGSGALFITPSSEDIGFYDNLMIIVSDENSGADTVFFSIDVNGNHTPTIDDISDVTLEEGESTQLSFSANDLNGNETLTWEVTGLPSFATFNSDINGNATIDIVTDFTSSGVFNIDVAVTDPEGASATSSFILTVNDVDPNVTVLVNFKHTLDGPSPWNNVNSLSATNLIDQNGQSTNIDLAFQTTTWKSYNDGAVTGNNSGVFPDNVIDDYYYFGIFGAPETVDVLISGLDPQRNYSFEFFASSIWNGAADNGHTEYTINGQTVALYVQGNNSNTVKINGISPSASGEVTFTMSKGADADVGYINALVIESIYDAGSVPSTPTDLAYEFDTNQNVSLSWTDAPFNENGYEVHKSSDGTNFSVLTQLAENSTSYTDTEISDNQTYYYKVSAYNEIGSSDFSNTVTVDVPNTPPSLDPIEDVTVGINVTVTVAVNAYDPPNNSITLTAEGLPAFASFADYGNGNGEITLSTSETDIGTYPNISITATDDSGDSRQEFFSITVEKNILYSVAVNFTKNTTEGSNWNNTSKEPASGDFFGDLIDDEAQNSGLGVRIMSDFGGSYNQGAQTGDDSGVVPDNVLKEYYWFGIFSAPETVTLRVEGLNSLERYSFKFVGSSVFSGSGVTDNGETVYKIGNQQVSVDVQGNTTGMGVISDIAPDDNGHVYVELLKGANASAGYINAMIVEAYAADVSAFVPSNLEAVGVSQSSVQLSWEDRTPDESGFEVYRSDNGETGIYSLLTTTGNNVTSFSDNTVAQGTIHHYKVRAVRPTGTTDFSNIANGAAILFSVMINVNGDPAYDAAIPWNNLGTFPSNGQLFTGFKDLNGNETGIKIFVEQTMSGFNDWGTSTGDDSGVYPDLVMKSFYFNDALVDPGKFNIEGLDQSLNYNFTFFGAIETGYDIYTNFTIGETTVTNAQTYNTSEVVSIFGVAPDINGVTKVQVQEAPGSNWAIWNAMVIDAYPVAGSSGSSTRSSQQFLSDKEGIQVKFGNGVEIEIDAYPVPFVDKLTVNISGQKDSVIDFRMISISGRTVFSKSINTGNNSQIEINTSDLDAGVYILELIDDREESRIIKVIKQ